MILLIKNVTLKGNLIEYLSQVKTRGNTRYSIDVYIEQKLSFEIPL
jgi:hypothetical protein